MIATANPETETAGDEAAEDDAAFVPVVAVAAADARKPKFGSPVASVFPAAPVAALAVADAVPVVDGAVRSATREPEPPELPAAASVGGAAVTSFVVCACRAAFWASAFAAVFVPGLAEVGMDTGAEFPDVAEADSVDESETSDTSPVVWSPTVAAGLTRPLVTSSTAVELAALVGGAVVSGVSTTMTAATGGIVPDDALAAASVWSVVSRSSLGDVLDDDVAVAGAA